MFGRVSDSKQSKKMAAMLKSWRGQHVRYLVPSTAPKDALFNPVKYWLGPVWPHVNLMIAEGLFDCGEKETAGLVVKDTLALLEGSGSKSTIIRSAIRVTNRGDWAPRLRLHIGGLSQTTRPSGPHRCSYQPTLRRRLSPHFSVHQEKSLRVGTQRSIGLLRHAQCVFNEFNSFHAPSIRTTASISA